MFFCLIIKLFILICLQFFFNLCKIKKTNKTTEVKIIVTIDDVAINTILGGIINLTITNVGE